MSSHGRARWLLIGLLAPVPLLLIGALLTQDAKHIADTDAAPATTRGDSARGKAIAATCVECHGGDGISASAAAPNLAGLSERAIAKQLVDYRRGARAGKSMQQASARLSDQDIADVAAHFAALAAPRYRGTFYPPLPDEIAASLAAHWSASVPESTHPYDSAPTLVLTGSGLRSIPPCANCHGPLAFEREAPRLAGQRAAYLEAQLAAFSSGVRRNDSEGRMQEVAKRLTLRNVRLSSNGLPRPALASYPSRPSVKSGARERRTARAAIAGFERTRVPPPLPNR